jgi:hypothetical protein
MHKAAMNDIVPLQWEETNRGSFGPGVSRPAAPERARKFTVMVRQHAAQPMKVTLMAESKTKAVRYASARWPGAAVEAT